jgi:uncharacterized protein (TIGR02117 family)
MIRARRLGLGLVVLLGIFVFATVLTARPGDPSLWPPPAGSRTVRIYLVSNGYHAGLALPHPALAELAGARGHAALIAVTQRFSSYAWIEFGWGDREFYRSVPTVADLTVPLALRALFMPGNSSVVHVVGLGSDFAAMLASADLVAIEISARGFEQLALRLNQAFVPPDAGVLADLGPGLYGPSLFYPANGTFSILKVCNHWIADLLDAAGLPTTPVLATVPAGLMLDLRWRAGLRPVSRTERAT